VNVEENKKAALKPITGDDVADVAVFLHKHMNGDFSNEEWERGLRVCWTDNPPNLGFMLQTPDGVVGVICALYSDQIIGGEQKSMCNPHTWCVLEPYRGKSVSLILALIRQPGFHFTMFSPNLEGEEIFSYLGFKPLEREMRILLNIPKLYPESGKKVTSSEQGMVENLPVREHQCYEDHRDFKWLHFLFYEHEGKCGFLIYKREKYKRLPCAKLIYISDKPLFMNCWSSIRTVLLISHGIFTTRLEKQLLRKDPGFSYATNPASAKFYLSESLPAEAIDYTYSELVSMDL